MGLLGRAIEPVLECVPAALLLAGVPALMPARAAIYEEHLDPYGAVVARERITFFGVHSYRVERVEDAGVSGRPIVSAVRLDMADSARSHRYENAAVPNDPWPQRFDLSVAWNCTAP
jgi:hypothetical protein